jgi:flagellar protein FlaG
MLIESVNGSGKNVLPLARAELPAAKILVPNRKEGPKAEEKPDFSDIANLVADAQRNLNVMHDIALKFSVHKASGKMMVTVVDESTGKVVREIPSHEILELAAKMDEMVGMIFDQKG